MACNAQVNDGAFQTLTVHKLKWSVLHLSMTNVDPYWTLMLLLSPKVTSIVWDCASCTAFTIAHSLHTAHHASCTTYVRTFRWILIWSSSAAFCWTIRSLPCIRLYLKPQPCSQITHMWMGYGRYAAAMVPDKSGVQGEVPTHHRYPTSSTIKNMGMSRITRHPQYYMHDGSVSIHARIPFV